MTENTPSEPKTVTVKEHFGFELNSSMKWRFSRFPRGVKGFIIIEHDTCDPTLYPGIRLAIREPDDRVRLLDYDPETEEEFLQFNWMEIKAWRPLTDHNGTWDSYFSKHPDEAVYDYKQP